LHAYYKSRTDQLDNKDIAKEFIDNMNNVETILNSFRYSYCIYHLKTFGSLKSLILNHNLLRLHFQFYLGTQGLQMLSCASPYELHLPTPLIVSCMVIPNCLYVAQ